MNFKSCSVKTPHTYPHHQGPGAQWGKPFWELGQEYKKPNPPRDCRTPTSLRSTSHQQRRCNDRNREYTLHTFADPPSHRSCVVSHNKDGLWMDSQSHFAKIGSKHMCAPRADQHASIHRNLSLPDMHPYQQRRGQFRNPEPWVFNAAFTKSSDNIGSFYHSSCARDQSRLSRTNRNDYFNEKLRDVDA